jgi:hypothetical protein
MIFSYCSAYYDVDVVCLKNEVVMTYRDGDCAMYVSPYNNLDKVFYISNIIKAFWSSLW